ncbi:MAG: D-alanyl-D-alanine carboxypeptidase family protein, partial [Mariprofundaceae bacterium]
IPGMAQATVWPSPPQVNAKSWAMVDARSGQIIAEHDADIELPPASLTKMMTLYLAFEDIKLGRLDTDERVSVSKKAWKIGGSTMFLEPRMHPTIDELLHGIATYSGNDACIALAEHVAGSEEAFAERMNEKAAALGMKHSHFVNSTGFPVAGHHSSARDMALLGAALWHDFPDMYEIFSEKSYTFDGRSQPNRNRLLWTYPEADGIKTGHTEEAGFCLVGSAEQASTRFVTAVFGTSSDHERARQSKILLKFGFRNFTTLRPAERDIRRQVDVYEGTEDHVWLKPSAPIWVTVPKGSESSLSFRLHYQAPLKAPISKGQQLGTIDAVLAGNAGAEEVLQSVAVIAARGVDQASWLGRQWDGLRLWWQGTSADAATDK